MNNDSLITKILRSVFFKKATGKAGRYASNTSRLFNLVSEVAGKLKHVGFKGNLAEFHTKTCHGKAWYLL
jgi:hypothetical protein